MKGGAAYPSDSQPLVIVVALRVFAERAPMDGDRRSTSRQSLETRTLRVVGRQNLMRPTPRPS